MDSNLHKPYNPKSCSVDWSSDNLNKWRPHRHNRQWQLLLAAAKPPLPPPSIQHCSWGKRNKNHPADRTVISIVDEGWNGPVQLLDPMRGMPSLPRNSET